MSSNQSARAGGSKSSGGSPDSHVTITAQRSSGASRGPGSGLAPAAKSLNFSASFKRLISRLRPYRVRVIAILVLSVASVVMNVLGPRILGHAVDVIFAGVVSKRLPRGTSKAEAVADLRANGQGRLADMVQAMNLVPGRGINFTAVGHVLLIVLFLYVSASIFQVLQARLLNGVVQDAMQQLRADVDAKLNCVPLAYIDSQPRGELLSRVTNDIDNVGQSMQQTMSQLLVSICTVVGVIIMMFVVSWILTLVALLTIPVVLVVARVIMKRSQGSYISQWKSTGQLNGQIEEAFTAHQLVKVFGRSDQVETAFAARNAELTESSRRAQFLSGLMMPIMMFVGNLQYVIICVVGGVRVATGGMTLGDVTAFIQYSRQFTQPVTQIASMVNLLQSGVASAERVFEVLDAVEESDSHLGELPTPSRGAVDFEHVTFGYEAEKPLIKNLNLSVAPGQSVAIVGPTGAGKTTLVNLIMRFYDLQSGRILLDGVDIASVPRAELRSRFGMVLQDSWLFHGTIRENILYGNTSVSDERFEEAVQATFVDRFVRALPQGYDTVIDDDGAGISSGERQLMTIARAFLADPAVLILDEATSSVDTRTEVLLQHAMNALRVSRTSFVIAHRLSTIRDADIILVMEDGAIVEQGSHEQLIEARGAYWRLYQAQFAGSDTSDKPVATS